MWTIFEAPVRCHISQWFYSRSDKPKPPRLSVHGHVTLLAACCATQVLLSPAHPWSCLRRPLLARRMQVSSSTVLHHRASCTRSTPLVASSSSCAAAPAAAAAPRYAAALRQQVRVGRTGALKSPQGLQLSSQRTLAGQGSWALVARCLPLMQRVRKGLLVRAGVESPGYSASSVDDPAEANKRAQVGWLACCAALEPQCACPLLS